jgi:hypothetical protein
LALALALAAAMGCGSAGGELRGAPTAELWGDEVAPTVGVRTYFVLDDRLEAQVFQTPRDYPGHDGKAAPFRIRTGLGMKRSLENRMARTFRNVAFTRTMQAARAGVPDQGKAELIMWPRLLTAEVEDGGATTTANVAVSVLVTTGSSAPLERITVRVRNTTAASPAADEDVDPNLARLNQALATAYDRVLADLGERIKASPSLRAIVDGTTKPMRTRLAIDYAAAAECAHQNHAPGDAVDVDFGRDDPEVRRQMDLMAAAFGDEEQLAVYLLTCQDEGADLHKLLEERLVEVGKEIDAGNFDAAKALLAPLEARGGTQNLVRAMSRRLENAIRARQEAEERERMVAEAAVREKEEAEARRIAEEEQARLEKEEAEREAAEHARRQTEADKLAKTARANLKRGKYDAARDDAVRALQVLPNHVEAMAVLNAIAQHERRRQEQELATLQRQVPQLIERCSEMKLRFEKAQQKEQEAAISGNPTKVQKMFETRQKASRDFNDARAKVIAAIQAYRQQGHGTAADAVERNARRPCNL